MLEQKPQGLPQSLFPLIGQDDHRCLGAVLPVVRYVVKVLVQQAYRPMQPGQRHHLLQGSLRPEKRQQRQLDKDIHH